MAEKGEECVNEVGFFSLTLSFLFFSLVFAPPTMLRPATLLLVLLASSLAHATWRAENSCAANQRSRADGVREAAGGWGNGRRGRRCEVVGVARGGADSRPTTG